MLRFRPQKLSKRYIIKERLRTGRVSNYNWQHRLNYVPANLTINRVGIQRRFLQMHYNTSHGYCPLPHWKNAEKMFNKKFAPTNSKASIRFLTNHTVYKWL